MSTSSSTCLQPTNESAAAVWGLAIGACADLVDEGLLAALALELYCGGVLVEMPAVGEVRSWEP
jgi:hypothetical protein